MKLSALSSDTYRTLEGEIKKHVQDARTLEQVGARTASFLYDKFKESIVLVRLYATLAYHRLPESDQRFLQSHPKFSKIKSSIDANTMVLSLMGSAGEAPEWNARLNSKGHLGIPLVSQDFVETLPMVSRVFKELGVALGGLVTVDQGVHTTTFGRLGGMFYVDDAGTAKDDQNRLIIPSQDFVKRYGVHTVFGTVGRYISGGIYLVIIFFCRENVERDIAYEFMSMGNAITATTVSIAQTGRFFAP